MTTRDPQQVNQMLDQLRSDRDDFDSVLEDDLTAKEANAAALEAEAAAAEAQIPDIRQRMNFQREARDQAGRDADTQEIRTLVEEASQKNRQAAQDRANALRLMSIQHQVQRFEDTEITVWAEVDYDDDGDVRGIVRKTHPIEDVDVRDDQGRVVRIDKGLRSLFRDGEADFDPADGTLRINGRRVDQ